MQELLPLLVLVTFCVLCGEKSFRRLGQRGTQWDHKWLSPRVSPQWGEYRRPKRRGFGPVRSERGLARKRRGAQGAGEDLLNAPNAKAVLQLLCLQQIIFFFKMILLDNYYAILRDIT